MTRWPRAGLILVFLVAATARVGWVVARHGAHPDALAYPDEHAYQLAARSLAAGHGLIDEFGYRATYMPAYPAFLALFERAGASLTAVRLVQALLGAWVAPAAWLLAFRWASRALGGPRCRQGELDPAPGAAWIALGAGLLAALDPFLLFFSGLLLTETLFTVCLVVSWWLVLLLVDEHRPGGRPASVGLGLSLLGCVMLRPSSTASAVLAVGVVVVYRRWAPASLLHAGCAAAVVFLGLLPWAHRNASLLGEWRWTTTRAGISLYDGLQPGGSGASDLAHTKRDPRVAGMGELAWDRYWRDQAWQAACNDPGRVVRLAGGKLLRTWNIVPNEVEHRRGKSALVSAAWMVALLVTACVGWYRVRRAARWWVLLLLPVALFTVIHMIFVGSVRYRIPLVPLVGVLSATGLWALWTGRRPAGTRVDPGFGKETHSR
jgi:4-amino-4-deoxy-L-arabinose transferase-like glycosyltransferase